MLPSLLLVLVVVAAGVHGQCGDPVVYSGKAEPFPLYDQWLAGSSGVTPTSTCGNQDLFFPNKVDRFVAIGYGPMEAGMSCGACVNMTSTSTGSSEVLTVIEGVNKANEGDVQISQSVAGRLGGSDITWKFVKCPMVGSIQYYFSPGATAANSAWIGFNNFAIGIRQVSVFTNDAWYDLQRNSQTVNWNLPSGWLSQPLEISLVSSKYEKLQFTAGPIKDDGSIRDSGVQFLGTCFEQPTTAPTPTPVQVVAKSSAFAIAPSLIALLLLIV